MSDDPKRLLDTADSDFDEALLSDLRAELSAEPPPLDLPRALAKFDAVLAAEAATPVDTLTASTRTTSSSVLGGSTWVVAGVLVVATFLGATWIGSKTTTTPRRGVEQPTPGRAVPPMPTPKAALPAVALVEETPRTDSGVDVEASAEPPRTPTTTDEARAPLRRRFGPAPSTSSPGLTEEVAQLARARAALSHDPSQTLQLVRDAARRFPNGMLSEERAALTVFALEALGQNARARTEARRFLKRYPQGPHSERVRVLERSSESTSER